MAPLWKQKFRLRAEPMAWAFLHTNRGRYGSGFCGMREGVTMAFPWRSGPCTKAEKGVIMGETKL